MKTRTAAVVIGCLLGAACSKDAAPMEPVPTRSATPRPGPFIKNHCETDDRQIRGCEAMGPRCDVVLPPGNHPCRNRGRVCRGEDWLELEKRGIPCLCSCSERYEQALRDHRARERRACGDEPCPEPR